MENLREQTIETYNNAAREYAEYFRGIGPRVKYIDIAFEAAGSPDQAKVLEIGCGDGRDSLAIAPRCSEYLGFDASKKLIELAKEHVPQANFEVADAVDFEYPKGLDIIFAFASLLHLNKQEVALVLQKGYDALKPGGIFYISLKWAPEYSQAVKEDEHGKRLFYFYNADIIEALGGVQYETVESFREVHGHTDWFELALRKVSIPDSK